VSLRGSGLHLWGCQVVRWGARTAAVGVHAPFTPPSKSAPDCRSEEVNKSHCSTHRGRARPGAGPQIVAVAKLTSTSPLGCCGFPPTPMKSSTERHPRPDSTTSTHWITTDQLAERLSCTRWFIRSLRESQVLLPGRDYIRISRFIRWDPDRVQSSLLAASISTSRIDECYEDTS
jgi:hypothetical protein